MADENADTADLTMNEKLDRILRRLAALESQGANTTRQLFDQIIKEMGETRDALTERMDRMEGRLQHIESQLEELTLSVMEVRANQRRLDDR
jgi:hypothetical protein